METVSNRNLFYNKNMKTKKTKGSFLTRARGGSAVERRTTNAEGRGSSPTTPTFALQPTQLLMGTWDNLLPWGHGEGWPKLRKLVCALQHQSYMRRTHDGTTFTFYLFKKQYKSIVILEVFLDWFIVWWSLYHQSCVILCTIFFHTITFL